MPQKWIKETNECLLLWVPSTRVCVQTLRFGPHQVIRSREWSLSRGILPSLFALFTVMYFSPHTEPVLQIIETSLEMLFLHYRPSVNLFFIPNGFHKARQIWQRERGTWDELRYEMLGQYDL